ncbi:MAG: DNA cytosine methyltransferase [Lysobacteraceae bacterium]|nr:MAG: DNA cytosine methyltransferase [Xanthomonadaceae bacterium]
MSAARKFKVLSLFSGGMGLDLGVESTGHFEIVACVEKVATFCNTIRLNQSKRRLPERLKIIEADISQLSPQDVLDAVGLRPEEIDVVIGGPPCQSFSTAGKRGTIQDPRGTLLWDFLRFVEHIQPKFFLMENVRGLLSAALKHRSIADRPEKGGPLLEDDEQPGSVVRLFAKDLANLSGAGYHLDIYEVNAVNYGAPQIRERALFIGNRLGLQVDFPSPTHGPCDSVRSDKIQAGLFEQPQLLPWKTIGDAIGNLKDDKPTVLDFSPRKKKYLDLVPPGSNWRSLPKDLQQESMGKAWHAKGGRSGWWRRLTFDLPSPTLVTMPNHASTALCHPTETRALSIREYIRIQEFPDEWEFSGTIAEQYTQVGNAVPTRLGMVAGSVIAEYLCGNHKVDLHSNKSSPAEPRIIYLQSHVRTRQWFKDGKAIVWDGHWANGGAAYGAPKTIKKIKGLR